MEAGHLIFESKKWRKRFVKELDYLIVGGGVSGLSAAYQLQNKDYLLFELGHNIGGSSSSATYQKTIFSQGAHYDWSYPENYGKEVLALFKKLDIISFNPKEGLWNFKDKKYIIKGQENQSLVKGCFFNDYLEQFDEFPQFFSIIKQFAGKMHLPTRLIDKDTQKLDKITFKKFLDENGFTPQKDFINSLNYQLIDDYGAGCETVSALAGIHYYMCRPYYSQKMELFSPPQGNSYFIEKLQQKTKENIKTKHVVKKITPNGNKFLVDIINIKTKEIDQYLTKNIIYAGQKHALKYILPEQHQLFSSNIYSPWVVVNIILSKPIASNGIWQNEFPLHNNNFMGFIDSKAQKTKSNHVLTCYYCFPPEERKDLPKLKNNLEHFTKNTISYLNEYFDTDLTTSIEKVFVKVMGHAMPIPTTNYLFKDKNNERLYPNLTFAGVDNGRLPLLFEAVDSGIKAVKELEKTINEQPTHNQSVIIKH